MEAAVGARRRAAPSRRRSGRPRGPRGDRERRARAGCRGKRDVPDPVENAGSTSRSNTISRRPSSRTSSTRPASASGIEHGRLSSPADPAGQAPPSAQASPIGAGERSQRGGLLIAPVEPRVSYPDVVRSRTSPRWSNSGKSANWRCAMPFSVEHEKAARPRGRGVCAIRSAGRK